MIYLDHAATSFPKSPAVLEAMQSYSRSAGSPGRSGHRMAKAADEAIWRARVLVSSLIGGSEASRVVFTLNATMAANIAVQGLLSPGDTVVTTSFEHNAVARPLHALRGQGVRWHQVSASPDQPVDLDHLRDLLREQRVRAVIVNHASNVTGAVVDLAPIRSLTREYGALLIVDAAQTLGHVPVSVGDADVIIFAGHKGLRGPQGTGGLHVSETATIEPILRGGTGTRSEHLKQPRWLPYSLESGTMNGVGIAGLAAAVDDLVRTGQPAIAKLEHDKRHAVVAKLSQIPNLVIHDVGSKAGHVPVVSVSIRGLRPADIALALDEEHGVLTRSGLHCAPLAHRALGTFPQGTVRLSFSYDTSDADLVTGVRAIQSLAEQASPD